MEKIYFSPSEWLVKVDTGLWQLSQAVGKGSSVTGAEIRAAGGVSSLLLKGQVYCLLQRVPTDLFQYSASCSAAVIKDLLAITSAVGLQHNRMG